MLLIILKITLKKECIDKMKKKMDWFKLNELNWNKFGEWIKKIEEEAIRENIKKEKTN